MSGNLASKGGGRPVAVITGGTGGVGAACARQMSSEGFAIAILDVNADAGQVIIDELSANGVPARFYLCDVADEAGVEAIADAVERELGRVERLVTAAAMIPNTESLLSMDMGRHDRMWQVNYNGTLHACRSFGRRMVPYKQGAIVTVGSINSLLPMPLAAYNPGKVAIARMTQILASELGRHSIRVNCVAPTYLMTPALQQRIDEGQRDLAKILSVHALSEIPKPEDVADAIAFLCSSKARMITGSLLPVDAGWHGAVSYNTYAGGVPWETQT